MKSLGQVGGWLALVVAATVGCGGPCKLDKDCAAGQVCRVGEDAVSACFAKESAPCLRDTQCGLELSCVIPAGKTTGLCQKPVCTKTCDTGYQCKFTGSGDQICEFDPTSPCLKACGAGFACARDADHHEICVIASGETAVVSLSAPAAGSLALGRVAFSCTARAPQLASVVLHLTPEGAAAQAFPMTSAGEATYTATVDTTVPALPDGRLSGTCELTYGASSAVLTLTSAAVAFSLDKTKPTVSHTSPLDWHRPAGSVVLTATIVDAGTVPSGIEAAATKLVLGGHDVAGTAAGELWSFTVDLATVTAPASGLVPYQIVTADRAGNAAHADGVLRVDGAGPTVVPVGDLAGPWHGRAPFTVAATIAADGAELAGGSVVLSRADHTQPVAGAPLNGVYSFTIDPATFAATGAEASEPWLLSATDVAGNETHVSGVFRIDQKAPVLTFVNDGAWHAGGSAVALAVTAVDGGSGLDLNAVGITVDGVARACVKGTGNAFSCPVATGTAGGNQQGAAAFVLSATDLAGNAASAEGSVNVDGRRPTLTVGPDLLWHGRGATVTIHVTATDGGGSGFAGLAPTLETLDTANTLAPKTWTGVPASGGWDFAVTGRDFLKPGVTVAAYPLRVRLKDAVGNEAVADVTRKWDDAPPVITVVADAGWYPRRGFLRVVASVSDGSTGSGLASAPILTVDDVRAASQPVVTGVASGGGFEFNVDLAAVVAPGTTATDFSFRLQVSDAAQNAATAAVTRRIDSEGPAVVVAGDPGFHGRAGSLVVTATLSDAGAGLGSAAPVLETLDLVNGSTARSYTGVRQVSGWAFTLVPTEFLKPGVTAPAFALQIRVKDGLDNETLLPLTRAFDDSPPQLTAEPVPYAGDNFGFSNSGTPGQRYVPRNTASLALKVVATDVGRDGNGGAAIGAGIDPAGLLMTMTGIDGTPVNVPGSPDPIQPDTYVFDFDARVPQLNAGEGPVTVTFSARDLLGSAASTTQTVYVTRLIWKQEPTLSGTYSNAFALSGTTLYVTAQVQPGASGDNVFAYSTTDGHLLRSSRVPGSGITPVTVGTDRIYYATDSNNGTLFSESFVRLPTNTDSTCPLAVQEGSALAFEPLGLGGQPSIVLPTQDGSGPSLTVLRVAPQVSGGTCVSASGPVPSRESGPVALRNKQLFLGKLTAYDLSYAGGSPALAQTHDTLAFDGSGQPNGVAVTKGGRLVWSRGGGVAVASPTLADAQVLPFRGLVMTAPTLSSETRAWFGGLDGSVTSVDLTTGQYTAGPLATQTTGDPAAVSVPPMLGLRRTAAGASTVTAYYPAGDARIRAVSESGTLLWTFGNAVNAGTITTAPVLDCQGVLYTALGGPMILAIQTDSTDGLADSGWPRRYHDNRNTSNSATPLRNASGQCIP